MKVVIYVDTSEWYDQVKLLKNLVDCLSKLKRDDETSVCVNIGKVVFDIYES